jgi:hypothetical protein
MITNSLEFPCVEAARCYLTEKEIGMRLTTVKRNSNNSSRKRNASAANNDKNNKRNNDENYDMKNQIQHVDESTYEVSFSKHRKSAEEWYVHLDTYSVDNGRSQKRILQLRHTETGQYLYSDGDGNVGCCSTPSSLTYWIVESAVSSSPASPRSPATPTRSGLLSDTLPLTIGSSDSFDNHNSKDLNNLQVVLISKEFPSRRLACGRKFSGLDRKQPSKNNIDMGLVTIVDDDDDANDSDNYTFRSRSAKCPAVWELQFTSGELVFMSNPVIHCQLRCNMLGQLSMSSKFDGWQVFRFIELGNGDVAISSWTHYNRFLSSNSDGKVYTVEGRQNLGFSERWSLEPSPTKSGVCIKSVAFSRYLTVGNLENEVLWTTTKPNDYAVWHLDAAHSHVYYLTSLANNSALSLSSSSSHPQGSDDNEVKGRSLFSNKYSLHGAPNKHISSSKKGPFMSRNKRKWEEWKVEIHDGQVTFFNMFHEKYLGCNSSGAVHTTTSCGPWSYWDMEESPDGGVLLLSREHHRYLAVHNDGSLCTTSEEEPTGLEHCWRLDPRLPQTISAGKVAGKFSGGCTNS